VKKLVSILAVLSVALCAYAWEKDSRDVQHTGTHVFEQAVEIAATGSLKLSNTVVTATGAELNLLDGVTATTAELNAAADASARARSISVTNGAVVTLGATQTVIIATTPAASAMTNVVTLATPYPAGLTYTIVCGPLSTNLVRFADSANVIALGADVELAAMDTLVIHTISTTNAVKISTSDN
jgi:hypothetical protein